MKDSTEKAAIWSAVGVIIAALITGLATYLSRPSEKAANNSNNNVSSASPQPTNPKPFNTISNRNQSNSLAPQKMYEAEAEVAEGKSYVDNETGFIFAVDEITDALIITGVLSRYTLPDGTRSRMYRWPVGHRVDFQYQNRKFYMVIQDIDYERNIARIRIKEIPS
ncbi:MAG TPA: hypothetical protein VM911_05995 [Pyrinomonadaceae bacterium]|jgi:hypothetical protein|nr:hypothetical protein [Pyrinomonadaceae bacterium]